MGSEVADPRVCRVDAAGWTGGLCGASRSPSTSATGGSGAVRPDGLERWMGGDAFFLNKEIIADKSRQRQPPDIKESGYPG